VANPDLVAFVFSCAEPDFHPRLLDRYLVGADAQKLPVLVVANKVDLVGLDRARELFAPYERLGYDVAYVSAIPSTLAPPLSSEGGGLKVEGGDSMSALRGRLHGKLSVLTGKSGVGKSSLLNALKPGLAQEVGRVSAAWKKGKHTTVVRQLFALLGGGYVADTPGLKALALWDIEPEELDGYFSEMRPLVSLCQFNDCTHIHEPGCAILQAVADGRIHPQRYQSYVHIRLGDDEP